MPVVSHILIIIVSAIAIAKGADWLTDSLVPVARRLGVSRVSVGLILVSAAVSLPEILVAIYTALKGFPSITFGVILGSIFVNIGLMTGLSAMIRPLRVNKNLILRDGIFSVVVPILVFAVAARGSVSRLEGLAFFLLFIPYLINVFLLERQRTPEEKGHQVREMETELDLARIGVGKLQAGWLAFALGLGVLLVGAQFFSNELINLASEFHLSELLIGLTIGAIGPSLPNILAAYHAARRGFGEIAVSETLGSNIFTLLVTFGVTAMVRPIVLTTQWLTFELPALILMSLMLFFFLLTKQEISRKEGAVLFATYLIIVAAQIALTLYIH